MFKNVIIAFKFSFKYLIYVISFFIPKRRDLWIFGAWFGDKYADNSKYLFEYVNEHHPEIRAVWLSKNEKTLEIIKEKDYETYLSNSFIAYKLSLRADIGIISTGIADIIPYTCGRMKLIQLWHGSPLKKIMFDDKFSKLNKHSFFYKLNPFGLRKEFNANNLYIAASEEVKNIISTSFLVPKGRVKITGYPRNDFNLNTKNRFSNKLEKILRDEAKIGIYLPTHRNEGKTESLNYLIENIDAINSNLKSLNAFLLIKPHFYNFNIDNIIDYQVERLIFIKDEDFEQDIYSILPLTDYLITDYSSVFFDYLLLDKPIIFAPFDIDNYLKNDRNFYYDYNDVTPGPKAKNWDDVLYYIKEALENPDKYQKDRKKINKLFNKHSDKQNCKRVFEEIINDI